MECKVKAEGLPDAVLSPVTVENLAYTVNMAFMLGAKKARLVFQKDESFCGIEVEREGVFRPLDALSIIGRAHVSFNPDFMSLYLAGKATIE